METASILVKGARVNNLKNIDLEIPRNKLVVFTGISGSGKSSWLLIPYMPRVKGDMWNPFLPTQGSFGADGQAGCGLYRRIVSSYIYRSENHSHNPSLL